MSAKETTEAALVEGDGPVTARGAARILHRAMDEAQPWTASLTPAGGSGTEALCRALMGLDPPEAEPLPMSIHESVTAQVEEWLEHSILIHRERLGL